MPHRAQILVASVNGVAGDPSYLAERNGAIAGASSIADLVQALQLGDRSNLLEYASAVDAFLPPAVIQAILAGYKGAAEQGTDGVSATWHQHAGFNVSISQAPGTDAVDDQGVVSVHIATPPLDGG